jgi:hypothetical protein
VQRRQWDGVRRILMVAQMALISVAAAINPIVAPRW